MNKETPLTYEELCNYLMLDYLISHQNDKRKPISHRKRALKDE